MKYLFRQLASVSLFISVIVPASGFSATNMLFILDGSNSMWGQIDGVAKINTAKDVLASLLTDLPGDTSVGLMVYGHRDKNSCTDIELVSAIGVDSAASLSSKIGGLTPKGKTPIAAALSASANAFSNLAGANNHVILISDGLETCNGDPCSAAAALASANIHPRVHVIGFDVGKEEQAQLECIPKAGNGRYFSAGNASELKAAVAEVKKVAKQAIIAPKPKPEPVKRTVEFFRDDFDGTDLKEHWEVINPDPESFIVENGELLMVAASQTPTLNTAQSPNIFKLSNDLPKGDWVLSASFSIDFQTEQEAIFLGLYDTEKDYLIVQPMAVHCGNWGNRLCFGIEAIKMSQGEITRFEKWLIREQGFENFVFDESVKTVPQPIELRIIKEGRQYRPGIYWKSVHPETKSMEEKWVELENFTILRQKGKPAMGIYQKSGTNGESAASIDWIKIEGEE
jgi:Ca-activated chloride channel family protein